MRRFKCQVDLDEDVLIFGGKDGVSVPFLSQSKAMIAASKMLAGNDTSAAIVEEESGVSGMLKSVFNKMGY
jgi:hypothetical protein